MALLLIAVAGVLTAGAVSVLMARSGMVEQMSAASQRRIALENSKALAQEFILERVMRAPSGGPFECNLSPASLGGITMPAWGAAPLQTVGPLDDVNIFDPGNGGGYKMETTATVRDGESSFERKYIVRSRSPVLAGNLLTLQTPASGFISVSALDVDGSAFVWAPSGAMTFTPDSYSKPGSSATVSFQNSAGTTLMPANLAIPQQIANPRMGLGVSSAIYAGQFDAINNNTAAANSSYAKVTSGAYTLVDGDDPDNDNVDGITCDGDGVVTITLATIELGNVYIPGNVSTLILDGQTTLNDTAADAMSSILIVVDQSASATRLDHVTLNNHNSRRFALAVKSAPGASNLPMQFTTGAANWRLLLELENTPILVTSTGIATIRGGIRTDRSVNLDSSAITGGLKLTLDSDPKYLERLATRTAWIESYAQ